MMVNINMIKNMVMEYMYGLMEEDMKDFGLMANNMAKVNIFSQMVWLRLDFGKMEKETSGWKMKMKAIYKIMKK